LQHYCKFEKVMMNFSLFFKNSDFLGIFGSILCLIHCLALPLFISMEPMMFQFIAEDIHHWDYVFLAFSFVAVYFSTRNSSSFSIKFSFYAVLILLTVSIVWEDSLMVFQYLGYLASIALIITHIINLRNCRKCTVECKVAE
jgi:hypothetical protein